jgi:hypothetical protein
MRTLIIRGKNDPMDLDKYGRCILDICSGGAYLFLLNQEEFPIDIKQKGDGLLYHIASSFAWLFCHANVSPQKIWEPVLRRALQLGLSLTPKDPGMKTALDSLFNFDSRQDSVLLGQEWLSLLASVGVDVDAYIREEKRIHDSGFLHRDEESERKRRLIFELEGNPKKPGIRWEWFYVTKRNRCF